MTFGRADCLVPRRARGETAGRDRRGVVRVRTDGGKGQILTAAPGRARQRAHDFVADLFGLGVEVEQNTGRDTFVFADQAEQDVLCADVVVAQRQGLAKGQLEDLLGARREGDLPGRHLFAGAHDTHDSRAHLFG